LPGMLVEFGGFFQWSPLHPMPEPGLGSLAIAHSTTAHCPPRRSGAVPSLINDPYHWSQRARETRSLAETVDDPAAKAAMQKVADEYDRLASRSAERAGNPPEPCS
jgi:hypothetical protein